MIKNENNKRFKLNISIECINTPEARKQMETRLSNLNFKELFSGKDLAINSEYSFEVKAETTKPVSNGNSNDKITAMPNEYFDY